MWGHKKVALIFAVQSKIVGKEKPEVIASGFKIILATRKDLHLHTVVAATNLAIYRTPVTDDLTEYLKACQDAGFYLFMIVK